MKGWECIPSPTHDGLGMYSSPNTGVGRGIHSWPDTWRAGNVFLAQHMTNSPHGNPYRNACSAWALGQGIIFPTLGTNKTPPSGLRPSGLVFCLPSGWENYSCPPAHAEKRHFWASKLCFVDFFNEAKCGHVAHCAVHKRQQQTESKRFFPL